MSGPVVIPLSIHVCIDIHQNVAPPGPTPVASIGLYLPIVDFFTAQVRTFGYMPLGATSSNSIGVHCPPTTSGGPVADVGIVSGCARVKQGGNLISGGTHLAKSCCELDSMFQKVEAPTDLPALPLNTANKVLGFAGGQLVEAALSLMIPANGMILGIHPTVRANGPRAIDIGGLIASALYGAVAGSMIKGVGALAKYGAAHALLRLIRRGGRLHRWLGPIFGDVIAPSAVGAVVQGILRNLAGQKLDSWAGSLGKDDLRDAINGALNPVTDGADPAELGFGEQAGVVAAQGIIMTNIPAQAVEATVGLDSLSEAASWVSTPGIAYRVIDDFRRDD